MPAAGGEGLEKIEDMIVRAAESTAAHVRVAKAAIGTVIFGQEKVVEQALVTILSGGHALLLGLPGLAKNSCRGAAAILTGQALRSTARREVPSNHAAAGQAAEGNRGTPSGPL